MNKSNHRLGKTVLFLRSIAPIDQKIPSLRDHRGSLSGQCSLEVQSLKNHCFMAEETATIKIQLMNQKVYVHQTA